MNYVSARLKFVLTYLMNSSAWESSDMIIGLNVLMHSYAWSSNSENFILDFYLLNLNLSNLIIKTVLTIHQKCIPAS